MTRRASVAARRVILVDRIRGLRRSVKVIQAPVFPTAPRACRYRATSQQVRAQTRPAHQPASTSLGQWTPRYTRLLPIRNVVTRATVSKYTLVCRRAAKRASKAPRVRYRTAARRECPLGKLGEVTATR